ncbi:class I SAM-dependent methyltransferase [Roseovarius sp.]|uniref:class I SAM-dependent methyltransferase n=1 Tax=Roseovarius sp. TaxID=1486281 RepID=UPI003BA8A128
MADDIAHPSHDATPPRGSDIVAPLSSRTLFWRARYLRESRFLTHVPFLFWLIETCRPGFVVKLGLGDGVSYFAACQALDKLETQADCVAIDTGEGVAEAELDGIRQYNEDNYSEFSQILGTDFRRAVNRFPDGSVDLLMVDVDIDEAMIDRLTHDWPRKLSERAVVLFHGTGTRFADGAAAGFLDRIAATFPHVSFEAGDGLMLVLYGAQRQDRLRRLTDLQPGVRGYSEIRHVFRRLGATHEYEWQSRGREAREAELQERLVAAEEELARLTEENARLKSGAGSESVDRTDDAPAEVAAPEGAAPAEIEELTAALAELRREAAARSSELSRLTGLLEQAEGQRIEETTELAARARNAEERAVLAETSLREVTEHRNALLASTSWKVTAPMRRIVGSVRRVKP